MIGIVQAFAPTYARARTQFLEAGTSFNITVNNASVWSSSSFCCLSLSERDRC